MIKRIAVILYTYLFLDDFVLLYPVYALLFSDTGLSVGQISSLFVIWSGASLVFEVPSGAWADAVSRRHPEAWIVSYERGTGLDAALAAGFTAVGPLRVWNR